MFTPRLGDIVRIKGTPVRGIWKRWNSRTERAVVIDEDGVLHETSRHLLIGEKLMHVVGESVIRKGQVPLPANIGRIMAMQPHSLTVILPSGKIETHPTDDWERATTESSVQVVRSGDRVEFVPDWQGGQPVADSRTTEQRNIDEVARVADLRADNETVEQDAEDQADDVDTDAEDVGDLPSPFDLLAAATDPVEPDSFSDSLAASLLDSATPRPEGEGQGGEGDHSAEPVEMVAPPFDLLVSLKPGDAIKIGDAEFRVDAVESAGVKTSFLSYITHGRVYGYLSQRTLAEASAAGRLEVRPAPELPAETELPPGEPEPLATVERIMNAAAAAPSDDLANIIDMLRRRIAKLEDDHEDALQLIAATAGRPAAPAAVEVTTLWQDDIQNWQDRNLADGELTMMRNTGWTVVHESHVIHPENHTVTRIIRLERPAAASPDGARAGAAAAQPMPTRTTATHIQAPVNSATLLGKDPALRQPIGPGRMTILPPERSADGPDLHDKLRALDAQVIDAAERAVANFRAANPPPAYSPFPSALPAGQ